MEGLLASNGTAYGRMPVFPKTLSPYTEEQTAELFSWWDGLVTTSLVLLFFWLFTACFKLRIWLTFPRRVVFLFYLSGFLMYVPLSFTPFLGREALYTVADVFMDKPVTDLCVWQGAMVVYFALSTQAWWLCLTVQMVLVVLPRKPVQSRRRCLQMLEPLYFIYSYLFPLIPLILSVEKKVIGVAGPSWCFVMGHDHMQYKYYYWHGFFSVAIIIPCNILVFMKMVWVFRKSEQDSEPIPLVEKLFCGGNNGTVCGRLYARHVSKLLRNLKLHQLSIRTNVLSIGILLLHTTGLAFRITTPNDSAEAYKDPPDYSWVFFTQMLLGGAGVFLFVTFGTNPEHLETWRTWIWPFRKCCRRLGIMNGAKDGKRSHVEMRAIARTSERDLLDDGPTSSTRNVLEDARAGGEMNMRTVDFMPRTSASRIPDLDSDSDAHEIGGASGKARDRKTSFQQVRTLGSKLRRSTITTLSNAIMKAPGSLIIHSMDGDTTEEEDNTICEENESADEGDEGGRDFPGRRRGYSCHSRMTSRSGNPFDTDDDDGRRDETFDAEPAVEGGEA